MPTRHHLTAGARDDLVGHHAVIIGDTPNDGLAADSAGIPFVAVATGAYTASELRQTSAILVIDDFASGLDAATADSRCSRQARQSAAATCQFAG